jgi:hypothetical protein
MHASFNRGDYIVFFFARHVNVKLILLPRCRRHDANRPELAMQHCFEAGDLQHSTKSLRL